MPTVYSQRAPFNDWWYWSECLVSRFKTISEIYQENGEIERYAQASEWAVKLKENCMVPVMAARRGTQTEEERNNVKELEETAILKAADMFRELLINLPFISSNLQDLLYLEWSDFAPDDGEEGDFDEKTGLSIKKKAPIKDKRLSELFWGPPGAEDEGIRSGKVEDGGLPGILYNLLIAESTSSSRAPTDYGQTMQSAASQQFISTNSQKAGMGMNIKPPGSI